MDKNLNINENWDFKDNFQDKYIPRKNLIRPSLAQRAEIQKLQKSNISNQISQISAITKKSTANKIRTTTENKYIKYKSKNSKREKIIRIQEKQEDPFCPAQYKSKRIPQGPRSPPSTILRSPPKKIKLEDQKKWKIPPCISNWKNSKGFLIPLEMRLSADGRIGEKLTINERFKKFTSALYNSEKEARKYLEEKKKLKKIMDLEEMKKQEEELKGSLAEAKRKKDELFDNTETESFMTLKKSKKNSEKNELEKKQRDLIRFMVKKDIEREHRISNLSKKTKNQIDINERDIAERVALGEKIGDFSNKELKFDSKLVNLPGGIDNGFKGDDVYDLYDKPLFKKNVKVNIYSGVKEFNNIDGDDEDDFLKKREGYGKRREKPIVFEKFDKKKIKEE